MVRRGHRAKWFELRCDVEWSLRQCAAYPDTVRIDGKLRPLGGGLNCYAYCFRVTADQPLPRDKDTTYVARILRREHDEPQTATERLQQEAQVLQALAEVTLPFQMPEFVCLLKSEDGNVTGAIETGVFGLPMDEDNQPFVGSLSKVEAIAGIAAAIHDVSLDRVRFLDPHPPARQALLAELDALDSDPLASDQVGRFAIDWVRAHLPPDRPAHLLHGDLLPQNIIWDSSSDRLGVIDWEFARLGDAAEDLVVVTRGHAKVLGTTGGRRQLVDAYLAAGGRPITLADIVCRELCMNLTWLKGAIETQNTPGFTGYPPSQHRRQIKSILNRERGGQVS